MPEIITKQNFKCDRYCGDCCKKTLVPISKKEIKAIEELGYKQSEFVMQDPFIQSRKLLQKKKNNWCVFLEKNKSGKYTCSIHKVRPFPCREYPFISTNSEITSCLPEDLFPNVFFKKR